MYILYVYIEKKNLRVANILNIRFECRRNKMVKSCLGSIRLIVYSFATRDTVKKIFF